MSNTPVRTLFLKSLAAIVALFGLAALVGRDLFPAVPINEILLWAAAAGLAGMAFLIVTIIVTAQFRQWVLRRGGTDASWRWFPSDPPGLEQQRAALKQKRPPQ